MKNKNELFKNTQLENQFELTDMTPKEKAEYLNMIMPDVKIRFINLKIQEWIDTDEVSILCRTYTKEYWLSVLEEA